MGMPIASDDIWTFERVQALPADGNKYELVWGELLVTPAPRLAHQRVVFRLARWIADYCDAHALGEAFGLAADISWGADTLVQPDVFVIAKEESGASDWRSVQTLRLVVEVLSPSTARHDRFQKRKLYQSRGVPCIWLVDIDNRFVEEWTADSTFPTRHTERVTWHPDGAATPLVIELTRLFDSADR
jgi:Uma2 family endonuclease